MAPVITKTTCELYKIRGLPQLGWAGISIDAAEEHGRISVSSDYGNFANFWSHCGMPFKKFLANIEIGYFAGKVGLDRWFDHERTVKELRTDILQRRRERGLTKEVAALAWDKVVNELAYESNEAPFLAIAYNCDALWGMYDGGEFPIRTTIDPMFQSFWKNCWPVFLEYLKQEELPPELCRNPCSTRNEYEVGRCNLPVGHAGGCREV